MADPLPLLLSLCSTLGLVGQEPEPRLEPALHHGHRTPAGWLAELEDSGGTSTRAVWALHYGGDRSEAVVEALSRWLEASPGGETRRVIDTLLVHWGLGSGKLPAHEYADPGTFVAAADLFPGPPLHGERSEEELLADLASGDALRIASAAAALVARDQAVERALVALAELDCGPSAGRWGRGEPSPGLDTAEGLCKWARERAGSGYVRALAAELERADDRERRLLLLRALERAAGDLGPAARSLEPLLDGQGEESTLAQALWGRALGTYSFQFANRENRDWALHAFFLRRSESVGAEAQESLARVFGARLEQALDRDAVPSGLLEELHAAALVSEPLARRSVPLLEGLLERDDGIGAEALRILCHLRVPSRPARERYLRLVTALNPLDERALQGLPCWPEHDEETLEAFGRLVAAVEDPCRFQETLHFAGLLDGSRSELVRRVIEGCSPGALHWMVSRGFRGEVPVPEDGSPVDRINALAMNIAAAQARGEDPSPLEARFAEVLGRPYDAGGAGGYRDYVQWGFFHAGELGLRSEAVVEVALRYLREMRAPKDPKGFGPFSVHTSAAIAYLDTAELSLEHELEVLELLPYQAETSGWGGINLAHPEDGGVKARRTAIELVPAIRRALYAGHLRALADLLAITRPTERDLEYLLAALGRGPVWDRRSALDLVRDHGLDSPPIAAAVRALRNDLDGRVADSARELCDRRGW